jgi:DNA-directed RNA polymerase specialized sigma24 family protein
MATLLVNDVVVAEEIVEGAYIAMHAAWWRRRNSDRPLAYLQRAVVRRARTRRVAGPDPSGQRLGPLQTGKPDTTSSDDYLVAALHALPARQREALVLRYYAGLADTEIAFVMGVPPRSATRHIERGAACLRAALERHHTPATDRPAGDARTPPTSS